MILILAREPEVAAGVVEGLRARGRDAEVEIHLDATNMRAVRQAVADRRPKAVLHMAFLDDALACEANPERAFLHNAESVINLAAATLEFEAIPVIWSPAQVLAGVAPTTEDASPQPSSTWIESRIRGEVFLRRAAPRGLVLRSGPVLSPGLAGEVRRLRDGVTVGSSMVRPVLASWLGVVLDAALVAQLHGVVHVPAAGPARAENDVWQMIASQAGAPTDALRVEAVAGADAAVLRSDREPELALSESAPDWTTALAEVAPAETPDEPVRRLVCEAPEVWSWVVAPGDTHRWSVAQPARLQAVAGKAFIEASEEDVVLKGTKQLEVDAGVELRVTVPETTVLIIIMMTKTDG